MVDHVHGPNCGCKEYLSFDEGDDLLGVIDIEKTTCLNEKIRDSCRKLFKTKDKKLDESTYTESDIDPELLFIIPFTMVVKLKSINIKALSADKAPTVAKLYINQENVDFSYIQTATPVQEVKLGPNLNADLDTALRIAKFQNVSKLILYLTAEGKDEIAVSYIGLKGIKTNIKKQVVITTYELKPNLADHELKNECLKNIEQLRYEKG